MKVFDVSNAYNIIDKGPYTIASVPYGITFLIPSSRYFCVTNLPAQKGKDNKMKIIYLSRFFFLFFNDLVTFL